MAVLLEAGTGKADELVLTSQAGKSPRRTEVG